jgi:hypothetical protein
MAHNGDNMGEKVLKVDKEFLFAGIFRERVGDLLICSNTNKELADLGEFVLPGGITTFADNYNFIDERSIPYGLSRSIERSAKIPIEKTIFKIQPMSAVYNAYQKINETRREINVIRLSAIIVGEMPKRFERRGSYFVNIEDFIQMGRKGLISLEMFRLGLRMLASRDCPCEHCRKIAGLELRKFHYP